MSSWGIPWVGSMANDCVLIRGRCREKRKRPRLEGSSQEHLDPPGGRGLEPGARSQDRFLPATLLRRSPANTLTADSDLQPRDRTHSLFIYFMYFIDFKEEGRGCYSFMYF